MALFQGVRQQFGEGDRAILCMGRFDVSSRKNLQCKCDLAFLGDRLQHGHGLVIQRHAVA